MRIHEEISKSMLAQWFSEQEDFRFLDSFVNHEQNHKQMPINLENMDYFFMIGDLITNDSDGAVIKNHVKIC